MSDALQRIEWGAEWLGLYARRQRVEIDRYYAEVFRNVNAYGGALSKRSGSRHYSGIRTTTLAGWTTTQGQVASATGLLVNDLVAVRNPDGLYGTARITGIVGPTITVSPALPFAPELGATFVARRPMGWGSVLAGSTTLNVFVNSSYIGGFQVQQAITIRHVDGTLESAVVQAVGAASLTVATLLATAPLQTAEVYARPGGLAHVRFRDGTQRLVGVSGPWLWRLDPAATPVRVARAMPVVQTHAAMAWGLVGLTGTGRVTSIETMIVGDRVQVTCGTGESNAFTGTIQSIDDATLEIVVLFDSPGPSAAPALNVPVYLFPRRAEGEAVMAQYANVTHVVAGGTPPTVYDGATERRHGIKPPTSAITAAVGAAGVLTGVYSYRTKFRNDATGNLSEPGLAVTDGDYDIPIAVLKSNDVTLAAQQASLTTIPVSPDPQVTTKELYRTLAGGDGVWYYLDEIPNATTTYADNIPDTALGEVMRELVDDPLPDGAFVIAQWPQANRLIALVRDTAGFESVVYSDQFDLERGVLKGEAWPPDNLVLVSFDDGDRLVGIAALYDSVLIFKEHSIHRITGTPPNIQVEPVVFRSDRTGVGSISHKSIIADQNEVIFAAEDGAYSITRFSGAQPGFSSARLSRGIDEEWARLTVNQRSRAHGVYFRRERQLRFFLPVDQVVEAGQVLVYQLEGTVGGAPHGWATWDYQRGQTAPQVILQSAVYQDPESVVMVTERGEILEADVGAADLDLYPYQFDYLTVPFAPGGAGRRARGRFFDLSVVPLVACSLQIQVLADYGEDTASLPTLDLVPESGFILDLSVLDVGMLGSGLKPATEGGVLLVLGDDHQIRIREFSNRAAFRLQGFNYYFQVLGPMATPRRLIQELP